MLQRDRSILPPRQAARPTCTVCQSRMEVLRTSKSRAGYEHWTLRCLKCGHIDEAQVNTDPLRSDAGEWIKGELRSPK